MARCSAVLMCTYKGLNLLGGSTPKWGAERALLCLAAATCLLRAELEQNANTTTYFQQEVASFQSRFISRTACINFDESVW